MKAGAKKVNAMANTYFGVRRVDRDAPWHSCANAMAQSASNGHLAPRRKVGAQFFSLAGAPWRHACTEQALIDAVDYVPLAIDLFSHLSQVISPEYLWEEWNFKWIKAIQTGQGHRLSNLECSIQLSINSGRMKANSPAKNMLGVLSMLSDGLHVRQIGKFRGMFEDLDVTSCLQTLLKCSLIKLTKERYQPHPIVHHFCVNEGMILPVHKDILEGFYMTLASSNYYEASSEGYEEMVMEANNTKATLLRLLESNYEDQSSVACSCTFALM